MEIFRDIKNRFDFIDIIPDQSKILEIGPYCAPLKRGKNVKYFDIADKKQLDEWAAAEGIANIFPLTSTSVPDIDYVSPIGDLSIIHEYFDYVISSHVIEHQVDLIAHLQGVENILNSGGYYFIVIPDKRYIFDHFRQESNIAHVISAHIERKTKCSLGDVIDANIFCTHNDALRHWKNDHGTKPAPLKAYVEEALKQFYKPVWKGHMFCFTPDSFKEIFYAAKEMEYTKLELIKLYTTIYNQVEFCVILKKS